MPQEDGQAWRAPGDRPDHPSPSAPGPSGAPGGATGGWAAPGGPVPQPNAPGPQGAPGPGWPPPHQGGAGWPPHQPGGPGWQQPHHGGAGWSPPPPDPKPGVVALRPLTLGDIFNGAFSYIRHNPKATLGLSVIVMAIASLLPAVGFGSFMDEYTSYLDALVADPAADVGAFPFSSFSLIGVYGGALLSLIAGYILNGLLAVVIGLAVIGRRVTLKGAIDALRGRIGALLGLGGLFLLLSLLWTVVLALVLTVIALSALVDPWLIAVTAVIGIPAVIALGAWVYIRTALAMPVVVLERIGPGRALGRSWRLTRGSWWRVFGILLLVQFIAGIVANLLATPFTLVSLALTFLAPDAAWMPVADSASYYLGMVLSGAVTSPFTAGAVTLLYVDLRMRREGLDLRLRSATRPGEQAGAEVYLTDGGYHPSGAPSGPVGPYPGAPA
ncbi:hypothetical protein GCM10027294_20550 [Marinactinospora endophytica]